MGLALLLALHPARALDVDVPFGGDIQAAIDEVSEAGGGAVNLAAGEYPITRPIRIRSRVTLNGRGPAETAIVTDRAIKSIEQASEGLERVIIRNLSITGILDNESLAISLISYGKDHQNIALQGVHASNAGWGVHIKGAEGVIIDSCVFFGNGTKGKEGFAHNLYLRRCKNARVIRTKLTGSTTGNGGNVSYSKNILFDRCLVRDNYFRGIRFADSDGCIVRNCIISGNGNVGLLANREKTPAKNILFTNTVVFENGQGGIQARNGVTGSVTGCRAFGNDTFQIDLNKNIKQSGNHASKDQP